MRFSLKWRLVLRKFVVLSHRRFGFLPYAIAVAFGVLIALAILALPFRHAPAQAAAAQGELTIAKEALQAGTNAKARTAVASAREQSEALQESVHGLGGDVWSWVPVLGGAVRDVRQLSDALDNLVGVVEIGVETTPQLRGKDSTLFDDGNVDLATLARVTDQTHEVSSLLTSAKAHLAQVADNRLLVGTRLGEARDEARGEVDPIADGVDAIQPLLEELPRILGGSAERKYLVALLNPAEMQNSGGTPLTFATIGMDQGRLTLDDPVDGERAPGIAQPRFWKKVPANPFHRGRLKLALATMAPDWAISGNELANAWRSLRGRRLSGVIAVDLVALADLVAVTGPIEHPTLGTLTKDNLVKTLAGSYDDQIDNSARKDINRSLAPAFTDRLVSGNPIEVGKVLGEAAKGRHFAVYLRNPTEQAVFDALGVTGRLAEPDRDYIGVFTQNRVASKSDYWQRRAVTSDVKIRKDGSAHVTLSVQIHNDSPPYLQPYPDPGEHYYTRWSDLSVLTMLPPEASITSGTVDGSPFPIQRGNFYGRAFQRQAIEFAPQSTHTMQIEYDVPVVADVGFGGALSYGLALDPQGMVTPQAVSVRVRFPKGFSVDAVPAGWQTTGPREASYRTPGLETSESFEVVAHP